MEAEIDVAPWQLVASAGRRYNESLRRISSSELSDYERERIARIQRAVTKIWHRIMPREAMSEIALTALRAPDRMTQFDGIALDNSAPSNAIRAGEAFVRDLDKLFKIAPTINHAWLLDYFSDNDDALDTVFGFVCHRSVPAYFPTEKDDNREDTR